MMRPIDYSQPIDRDVATVGPGMSAMVASGHLRALQATLVRAKRSDEVIPVPEAAREICQPGS